MTTKRHLLATLLALFWVGYGIQTSATIWVAIGILLSVVLTLVLLYRQPTLHITPPLLIFTSFNVLLVISSLWSQNQLVSFRLSLLSLSGCLWWFMGSNLKAYPRIFDILKQSLFIASFLLITIWILALIFHLDAKTFGSSSLVVYASMYQNHNHLGDFLIIPLLLLGWPTKLAISIPLLIIVIISQSRSALIGFIIGMGYLWFNQHLITKYKKYLLFGFVLFFITFTLMSLKKITFPLRDYYIQSLAGFTKYPLGIGYGDFGRISEDPSSHWFGFKDFSYYAHSLPLEWLSGVGAFGLLGIFWLVWMMYQKGTKTTGHYCLWTSVWWGMLINLLLDTTYIIPTYWWLFMLITGLINSEVIDQSG